MVKPSNIQSETWVGPLPALQTFRAKSRSPRSSGLPKGMGVVPLAPLGTAPDSSFRNRNHPIPEAPMDTKNVDTF